MSSKLMLSLAAAFALSAAASAPARADPMPSGEGREVTQSQTNDALDALESDNPHSVNYKGQEGEQPRA